MKKITTLLAVLLVGAAIILPTQTKAQSCSWAKKAGSTNEDQGTAVATDASGNVYYLGNFYSQSILIGTTTLHNQPYQASNYGSEMWLAKYDSCGTFKWAKQAGGKSDVYGAGLATDAAGNIYVTGYFQTDTAFFGTTHLLQSSYQDAFLVKYRPNGTVIWAKSGSGNDQDQGRAITADALGDVYITGTFASTNITFGTNSVINGTNDGSTTDGFIAKFDTSGNNIWVRGNTSNSATGSYNNVTTFGAGSDAAGNVYVGGRFVADYIRFGSDSVANTNSGYSDIFITMYDANGNIQWVKSAGTLGDDGAYALTSDAGGNSYITGYIGNGTATFGPGVSVTSTQNNRAIFIAKYNNAGAAQWAKIAKADYWSNGFGTSVSLDANSNVYITGTYSSDSLKFGPVTLFNTSYLNANPNSDTYYDIFVAKYKANGILSWARTAGGDSTDFGNGIATGPNSALYITGSFNSPTLSFAGVPTLSLTANSAVGSYNPGVTSNDAFISNNIATLPITPDICLVSADSINTTSQFNIIYWDKTPYNTVSNFILYREVTSGVYKKIGSQPYSSLSMFVDNARSVGPANGDPLVSTYRYKLQIMDTAGTYSLLSPYHNTVYFQNNAGTFNWNQYAVEGMTITPVTQFDLMRDDNHTGAWHSIGFTAGTQVTLNDPSYTTYQATADWRVDAQGFSCTPTLRLGNNATQSAIVKSKSNISNNRGIGVSQISNLNSQISVYPNPAKDLFVIETDLNEKQHIQVIDVNGKVVLSTTITGTTSIDAGNLSEGVYTINIVNNNSIANKRLVIVK